MSGRRFLVDSGAQRSIVPASSADTLGPGQGPSLGPNGTSIRTFGTRLISYLLILLDLFALFQSCALFMHLVPFFVATSAYFYLWTPESVGSTVAAGVKSAPALLLAVVVLSWNGPLSILGVAGGLLFSAVGDFCLVFPDQMFIHGMAAFAVAHLLYSLTFLSSRYSNDSSSSWPRLFYPILLVTGGGFYFHLYPYLQKAPNPDLMVPAVGIYVVLITLMGSLAIRTRRLTTVLGSLVFMVSDISLAVQVFKVTVIEHGTVVVMVTYYLSQLLIAVGDVKAVEGKEDFSKWKRA